MARPPVTREMFRKKVEMAVACLEQAYRIRPYARPSDSSGSRGSGKKNVATKNASPQASTVSLVAEGYCAHARKYAQQQRQRQNRKPCAKRRKGQVSQAHAQTPNRRTARHRPRAGREINRPTRRRTDAHVTDKQPTEFVFTEQAPSGERRDAAPSSTPAPPGSPRRPACSMLRQRPPPRSAA